MSNDDVKSPVSISIKHERLHKILTLDYRNFTHCHPKVEEQWSWVHLKNEKFLVHFDKYAKHHWDVRKLVQ